MKECIYPSVYLRGGRNKDSRNPALRCEINASLRESDLG